MLISSTEPPLLRALGHSTTAPEQMGCDVLFSANGKLWGVQRKEFDDLYASFVSGDRLAKELGQMQGIFATGGGVLLIVEGSGRWDKDGRLIDQYRHWTRSQYRRLLLSVQQRGAWIMHTRNLEETADAILDFKAWAEKDGHNSLSRRAGAPEGWRTWRDRQIWMLQGIEGMGPELAGRVVDTLGRAIGWRVTMEQLRKVRGLGKVKAKVFWDALESED